MKKYLSIIALMASVFSCKAQTVIYNMSTVTPEDITTSNNYIKDIDNHHDAIVGIWRWQNGDDSFEITLQEFEMYNYPDDSTRYRDLIFGRYTYIKDSIVIAEVTAIEVIPNFKVLMRFQSPTEYTIWLEDTVSETAKKGKFILTSPTTAVIQDLKPLPGIKVDYGNGQEWALPNTLTLTKQ